MRSIVLVLLVPAACASVAPAADIPLTVPVRASIPFTADGTPFEGSALLQRRSGIGWKFSLSIPGGSQRVEVKSCHRRKIFKKPASPFVFQFTPAMFVENWSSCPLEFSAVTKSGFLQRAIVDFSANETLPARLQCDAETRESGALNASFCHAAVGTWQRISFSVPVKAYSDDGCASMRADGLAFEWRQSQAYCVYYFRAEDGRDHRLTTYGWAEVERDEQ